MFIISNVIRTIPKYRRKLLTVNSWISVPKPTKNFHCSVNLCVKMFLEHENSYAYTVMEGKGYTKNWNIEKRGPVPTKEQFERMMKEDWSKVKSQQLFEVFPLLGRYCSEHGLCISNKIFNNFIDSLSDNIMYASDQELEALFYALLLWPETESIRTTNYIEVWAALDDACLNRLRCWSYDEVLHFISLFYMLNVTKASDFATKSLNKLATKGKHLNRSQLVQTMFYVGVMRKQPFDMHNLELRMIDIFQELSLDDMAIMSMGFFKSKTPIRSMDLITRIVNRIIENSKKVHEVSLAALLKIMRYSVKINADDKIYRLLDALQYEVPRLSVMCIVHLALLGTSTLTYHSDCLNKILDKMIELVPSARLKDLERIVLTYGIFNFTANGGKETFFLKVIDELRNPKREAEITKHGKCFACCVSYLGLLRLYPVDLMDKVLSQVFLENSYGKHCYLYGREILAVHNSSQIFCAESKMNHLSDKVASILAKKYTDYVPSEDHKKQYNVSEIMFLDVYKTLKEARGDSEFVVGDHIVTHHQRGDIILCNSHYGKPLPVTEEFNSKKFGLIRTAPDNNHWIVLVIVGRNGVINGTHTPTGHFQSKVNELKTLGYHSTLVLWPIYTTLKTQEDKLDYLNDLIKEALK